MKILFWLYKSRANKNNDVPIYCRVTIAGERKQLSIRARNFNQLKGRCKGRSDLSTESNNRLDNIERELMSIYNSMSEVFKGVTATDVVANYQNDQKPKPELVEVFALHNDRIHSLIGKDYTLSTYNLYENTMRLLTEFISRNKGKVLTDRVRPCLLEDFIYYLRTEGKLQKSSIKKHIQRLNRVLNFAVSKDLIEFNPCSQIKVRQGVKEINYLSQTELTMMESVQLDKKRLDRVRAYFLFMCATGLSHVDMMVLNSNNLIRLNEELWIEGRRIKSSRKFKVLVSLKAIKILDDYRIYSLDSSKPVFDFISNQQMNRDLKSICSICGIPKSVSTHWGRKTFSTLALSNGLSIESISAVLGHSTTAMSLKSYAKILDGKLENDMRDFNRKLA